MSTISTHLNWGSSYIVNDFYKQQIKKNASEKELVNIGRISTIILFESSEGHNFNMNKILIIVSAIVLAYFI